MKIQFLLSLLFTFVLGACTGPKKATDTKQEPITQGPAIPSWIQARPLNSAYYIGIGSASKLKEPLDYQQIAKKNALNDLSSEIRVIVEGESFLNTIDRNYNFEEEFRSQISTRVLEDIQDFEVVDAYETPSEYWVYYRLSKAEHARIKKEKKDRTLNAAFDLFTKGKDAISNSNFSAGFDMQLRALFEMKDYWNEVNPYLTEEGTVYLDNEIYSSLRKLGTELKLEIEENPIVLQSSNDFKLDVPVLVSRNSVPVKGVNLSYQYDKGKYSRPAELITGEDGRILVNVQDVNLKSSSIYLAVWIDLNRQIASDLDKKLAQTLVESIKTEELNVPIRVVYPRMFFESVEKVFGNIDEQHRLKNALAAKLSSDGFSATSRLNDADYEVFIQANTTEGGVSQGFHVAFLDMTLSVKSRKTDDIIFKRSFTKLKGLQLNFNAASVEAYKKGIKLIEDEVCRELIDQIL